MRRFTAALGAGLIWASAGWAQVNGAAPAELPPAGFEGREYVDSRGCIFMRTTFGGEVTWVPRYGPDRQIVCDQTPTLQAAAPAAPAAATTATVASPLIQPVAPPVQAAPARAAPAARAPQRRAPPRADASGRHPSCPASAPYGQLVDTVQGRKMVRCVTSPALFLDQYFDAPSRPGSGPQSSLTMPSRAGNVVQVGSFAVPSNAARLHARLRNAGMPVRVSQSRGLSVVSVGPFSNAGQAQSALSQVRSMGFHDAFLR